MRRDLESRRIDLHLHTLGSFDSRANPEAVFGRCRRLGLGPVFITDHDSIHEAARLQAKHPGEVVVGEEITTSGGEVIGLYLQEAIPAGLSPADTVARIKAQGGLVYLEHPLDPSRRSLTAEAIEEISDQVDIVEVHNARSGRDANRRGIEIQRTLGAAPGAGSDAHRLDEIGSVYLEVPDFDSPQELVAALRQGRIVARPNRAAMRARQALRSRFSRA